MGYNLMDVAGDRVTAFRTDKLWSSVGYDIILCTSTPAEVNGNTWQN